MRTMIAAKEILSAEQLRQVRARSSFYGTYLVAHAWVVMVLAACLVAWMPNPATIVLAAMIIGSRQLGLAILMHEGAHGGLHKSSSMNHILAQWFCAWPIAADVDVYRKYHLKHHANTLSEADPDIVLTGHYPISRASLKRKLIRDLTGQSGYAQRKFQIISALKATDTSTTWQHFWRELGPASVANLLLLLMCTLAGYWWLYFTCWVLPLLTWYQVVLRVRNIAEHAVVRGGNDPFGTARTTYANWIERIFVAPYWVNFHLEHHLLVYVPCYRLPLFHRFLRENGYAERMQVSPSYLSVLIEVTSPEIDDAGGGKRAVGTFGQGYE
ncbi:MAG: fatty acid desaturase family protein [Gammaproteobacteria bacterium]